MSDERSLSAAMERLETVIAAAETAIAEAGPARAHLSVEDRGRLRILREQVRRADELVELELAWCEHEDEGEN